MVTDSNGYRGNERRSGEDRRVRLDQRTNVRFDDKGGDRREGSGRRSTDVNLEIFE